MANQVRGEVEFEAEGERYTLLLDFNALCELEDTVPGLMDGSAEMAKPSAIRAVFHGALQAHHPEIDPKGAGRLIQAVGIAEAGDLIKRASEASFGKAEGKNVSRPQKAPAKAGAGSAP